MYINIEFNYPQILLLKSFNKLLTKMEAMSMWQHEIINLSWLQVKVRLFVEGQKDNSVPCCIKD